MNKSTLYIKTFDLFIQNTAYINGVIEEPEPVTMMAPKNNKRSNIGIR